MKQTTLLFVTCVLLLLFFASLAVAVTYEYDRLHRLTKVTYDDGSTITYVYDSVGNRTRMIVTNPNPACPADFNGDGDVDPDDFSIFEHCATGPQIPYGPGNMPAGCTLVPDGNGKIAADFDKDGDVDQEDFGIFQRCYSGFSNPANPNCAN